jgi:hypothetical protein
MKKSLFWSCILLLSGVPAEVRPFGIDFSLLSGISYSHSGVEQEPCENWQENYFPQNSHMSAKAHNHAYSWDLGLQAELQLVDDRKLISFGIPVTYYITFYHLSPGYYDKNGQIYSGRDFLTIDKNIAGLTVDWWNKVPVRKIRLRKTHPAVGFSIKFGILKSYLRIQADVQKYALLSEDYKGIDKPGEVNTAQVIRSTTLEKGWGWRFDVQYAFTGSNWRTGLYYERNGGMVYQLGFSIGYHLKSREAGK